MKSIAVLLTCYNRCEKTLTCMKLLFEAELPECYTIEVFLVDDGSTDGTGEAVKNKYPQINVIQGDGTLYWNRGMYLAWETATNAMNYDFFLWLNDDTLLFNDALMCLLKYSESVQNKRILIGATCSEADGSLTYSGFNYPDKIVKPNGIWQDCDFFNGNIVLIPSFVYHSVGGLENRFHHTLGDFDYGKRALKLGFIHSLSPRYLGTCEAHMDIPAWCNSEVLFFKRLKYLYSPLGNNPFEFFIYDHRHNGFFKALFHFFTIHLRAILPSLWRK